MSVDQLEHSASEEALRRSEERYRAFIEQSSEAIWRVEFERPFEVEWPEDEQIRHAFRYGYLAECNDEMARMYGLSRSAEIVGARLGDLLIPSDRENIEYLRKFIRSGYRMIDAESHEVGADGKRRYFLNNLLGAIENAGVVRAWGTRRDVTERMQAEEAVRRTEANYRELFENANDIIYTHDLDGSITSINRAAERITGYSRDEVIGLNIDSIVAPEHLDLARRMIRLKLAGEPSPTYQLNIVTKGRRQVPVPL